MILLNDDEKELRAQIDYLKKYVLTCMDPAEIFDSVSTCKELLTSCSISYSDIIKSFSFWKWMMSAWQCKKNSLEVAHNLKINRRFHLFFLSDSFFIDSDDYHIFKGKRGSQLLKSFLKEEDVVLFDLFQDMRKAKRIYLNKSCDVAESLYNNFQDIPNIFMPDDKITCEFLGDLVHELGHMKTEMDINRRSEDFLFQYNHQSLYTEVMAYYYEYKFYGFLLENHLVRKEAKTELFRTLDFVSDNLRHDCTTFQLGISLSQSLFDNMQYSYGPMVAASLCSSNELMEAFCKIQHEPFSKETLDSLGLTTEKVGHDFQKQMRSYFKS